MALSCFGTTGFQPGSRPAVFELGKKANAVVCIYPRKSTN